MHRLNHWPGIIAVIIALGVSISVIVLAISELDHGTAGHISSDETTLLATVLGAGIGAVAAYLGTRDTGGDSPPVPPVYLSVPPKSPYDQDASTDPHGTSHTTGPESDPSA